MKFNKIRKSFLQECSTVGIFLILTQKNFRDSTSKLARSTLSKTSGFLLGND